MPLYQRVIRIEIETTMYKRTSILALSLFLSMLLCITPEIAAQDGTSYAKLDRLPDTAASWRLTGAADSTEVPGQRDPYGAELIRPGLEPGIHVSGGGPLLLYYRYPRRHYNMPVLRAPLLRNGLPWLNAPDSLKFGRAGDGRVSPTGRPPGRPAGR